MARAGRPGRGQAIRHCLFEFPAEDAREPSTGDLEGRPDSVSRFSRAAASIVTSYLMLSAALNFFRCGTADTERFDHL